LRARLTTLALTALAALAGAGSAGAATVHWHPPIRIEPGRNGGLSAVSCPSSKLCVAVDQSGYLLTTTNPTGSGKPWKAPVRIDSAANGPLTGISCPTVRLCVAVDASGNVITSTRPTGGARAWSHPAHVDPTNAPGGGPAGLVGISCASPSMCVAVDGGTPGNVVSSTAPTHGATAWKLTAVGGVLTNISCPTTTLCIAVGSQRYVSTTPTGGPGSWKPTGIQAGAGAFDDITCPSALMCVASGYSYTSTGAITTSTNPHGGPAAWSTNGVELNPPSPGSGLLDGVGCMASTLCVAVDSTDNVFTSTAPTTAVWSTPVEIGPASAATALWSSIACATTVCVVVDSNGYAVAGGKRG
jgi:hypothetical protein